MLALQNNGFARKIYVAADAALQLQGFYKEESEKNVLCTDKCKSAFAENLWPQGQKNPQGRGPRKERRGRESFLKRGGGGTHEIPPNAEAEAKAAHPSSPLSFSLSGPFLSPAKCGGGMQRSQEKRGTFSELL